MIERVVFAKSYDDLAAAGKALDRILLWNNYVVPQWSFNKLRTARWDRFSHPIRCRNTAHPHSRGCGGGTLQSGQDWQPLAITVSVATTVPA
jgi:hypothetical protein